MLQLGAELYTRQSGGFFSFGYTPFGKGRFEVPGNLGPGLFQHRGLNIKQYRIIPAAGGYLCYTGAHGAGAAYSNGMYLVDSDHMAPVNCSRKRVSFSENRRRSLIWYLSMVIRSIPIPKAKPVYFSGSIPQFSSTFGCTMPQPNIST